MACDDDKCTTTHRSIDYQEIVCSIYSDALLHKNQSLLNDYLHFCSVQMVLTAIDANKKQLHLCGTKVSTIEAKKRFLELQNTLLMESMKKKLTEGVYWWYEAWDASWRLYDSRMTEEIEYQHQNNQLKFTLLNQIGEKVTIDLNKAEEIYGTRIKRIRRCKIDQSQPNYWTLTPSPLERFTLETDSQESRWIIENFNVTMAGHYTTFISIERIQNVRLFKQFHLSHEDYIVRHGTQNNGTMRYLYHGCPEDASNKIIERGFNRSYCGIHGCVYGRGVYFSANANYSDKYATPNDQQEKRMFFSRTLLGRSMIGNAQIREPADGYDTTTDGTHIFVCYYDSQCYPEYLLTYR